jgi:hypothetical protein
VRTVLAIFAVVVDFSGGCANSPDRLIVRDGADQSPSNRVLAQFCGTSNGQTVVSSAENLHIELITDAVNQRQGFAAEFSFFEATADGSGPTANRPPLLPGSDDDSGLLTVSTSADVGVMPTPSELSPLDDDTAGPNDNGKIM